MAYTTIITILIAHFVGDFVLQTNWMSLNKAKNFKPLLAHIAVYTMCLLVFGYKFALINGVAHLITDMVSSRVTYYLWNQGKVHWFFIVLGADQLIHYACLFGSYSLLIGG